MDIKTKLEDKFIQLKGVEDEVHNVLQIFSIYGYLLEEMHYVKLTLDMAISTFYKRQGSGISDQVVAFMKTLPAAHIADNYISKFQKSVQDTTQTYARLFNHFKAQCEPTTKGGIDSQNSAGLLNDMEIFYEQRHCPMDTSVHAYMELASTLRGSEVKNIVSDTRDAISEAPAAHVESSSNSTNSAPGSTSPTPGQSATPAEEHNTRIVDFNDCLESPVARQYFLPYLDTQFSGENLHFWADVGKYRKQSPTMSPGEISAEATRIVNKYVALHAETQVNLSSSIRDEVLENMHNPTPDLFEVTKPEVKAMLHGIYVPYTQTEDFRLLQQRYRKSYMQPILPLPSSYETTATLKDISKAVRSLHQMISKSVMQRRMTTAVPPKGLNLNFTSTPPPVRTNTSNALSPRHSIIAPFSFSAPVVAAPVSSTHENIQTGMPAYCLAFVDPNCIWIGQNDTIAIFNVPTQTVTKRLKHPGRVHSILQVSPSEVWSASDSGPIKVWDPEKLKGAKDIVATDKGEVISCFIKVGNDGVWIGTSNRGTIRIVSASNKKKQLCEIKVGQEPIRAMATFGSSVWVAQGDDITRYHAISYRKCETLVKQHTGHINVMLVTEKFTNVNNYSSVTQLLWTAGIDGNICVWDAEVGKCITKLSKHTAPIHQLCHSKKYVYSSSDDRKIVSWDKQTLEQVNVLADGHTNAITCVLAITKPTPQLWSGSTDTTIRVWPVESP